MPDIAPNVADIIDDWNQDLITTDEAKLMFGEMLEEIRKSEANETYTSMWIEAMRNLDPYKEQFETRG